MTPILRVVLVVALALAACGDGDDAATDAGAETSAAAEATSAPESTSVGTPAAAFPLTIEHKFGATTITAVPERVISVGYNEHDFLLALGVVPVGLRDWYGEQPNSVWPWATDQLGDETPDVIGTTDGINYEAVAALDPDVIVGIWSGMTQEEYDLLSAIAPTVAQSDAYADYGTPWQEQTEILGLVTDRTAEAAAAVARIDARLAEVRAEHPEWEGLTATVAFFFGEAPGAYNTSDPRSRFLSDLGFTVPEEYDVDDDGSGFFEVSAENLGQIDTDLIVWVAGDESQYADLVSALPTRQTLRATQEGREIFASTEITGAFSHSSPLSLGFVIEELVAEIELAVDGDPTTVVPSAAEFADAGG